MVGPMHVFICGGTPGSGGFQAHLRGILCSGAIPSDAEVHLLASPKLAEELPSLDRNVSLVVEPLLDAASRFTRLVWWHREFPLLVRKIRPDVILYPSPLIRRSERIAGIPYVVISENLLLFDNAELLRYARTREFWKLVLLRVLHARSLKYADGVVFPTDYYERTMVRAIGNVRRSLVVYYGLDSAYATAPQHSRALGQRVDLLYVSPILLYKHQWHVVRATALLRERLGRDIRLTLVGGGEPAAQRKLAHVMSELGAASFVTCTGPIPAYEMPAVYRKADIFVFASSCEAFGLVLLEGMGVALPVACSNRSALPEILGPHGAYFDPENPHSIAKAVETLIEDDRRRMECASGAHERAKEFTWQRCAEQTFSFLRSVVELKGNPSLGRANPHTSDLGYHGDTPKGAGDGK